MRTLDELERQRGRVTCFKFPAGGRSSLGAWRNANAEGRKGRDNTQEGGLTINLKDSDCRVVRENTGGQEVGRWVLRGRASDGCENHFAYDKE